MQFSRDSLADPALQQALRLAAVLAVIKLAIQIATNLIAPHLGYGYFRDELYYLICARHMDWGYVDQPPLVALQAKAAVALFGNSIAGIRMLSAIAGALKVFLTGLLAWSLGGKRTGQILAMVAVIVAPVYLGADGFLSMNSFEPVFWMGCVLALILLARGDDPRWWLAIGLLGGLGLENKHSTTFFLFAVLFALLVTPQRRLLWNKWLFFAILLIVGVALPNLIWEARHHWATYELLNNIKHGNRNVVLGPVPFMLRQMLIMNPFAAPLWIAGLLWLFVSPRTRSVRFVGWIYLFLLVAMIALKAKDYYVAPIYPMLLAAGAVACELAAERRPWLTQACMRTLIVSGLVIAPLALPTLPPPVLLRYMRAIGQKPLKDENFDSGGLPQQYADMIGWPQLVSDFRSAYDTLSPEDRARVGIFCGNYGDASAINYLGPRYGLPLAISGHQNYFLWGPQGYTGELMLAIGGDQQDYEEVFDSVKQVGQVNTPYSMGFEHRPIFLCRHRKHAYVEDWQRVKHWD